MKLKENEEEKNEPLLLLLYKVQILHTQTSSLADYMCKISFLHSWYLGRYGLPKMSGWAKKKQPILAFS